METTLNKFWTGNGFINLVKKVDSKRWLAYCTSCSRDMELWGSFLVRPYRLSKGFFPCSCNSSGKVNLKPWQLRIKVLRLLKTKGYSLVDSQGFKGKHSKVLLLNPSTGNTWEVTINNLFNGEEDPSLRYIKSLNSKQIKDETTIRSLPLDLDKISVFRDKGSSRWKHTCNVCSEDKYVRLGLCDGIFNTNIITLRKGQLSCRCSRSFRWSKEQYEYQLKSIDNGCEFLRWVGTFKNNNSKFIFKCPQGHLAEISVSHAKNNWKCGKCVEGSFNGYYPERSSEKDTLYLTMFGGRYLKVGRAFEYKNRKVGLLKKAGMSEENLKLLHLFTATHKEVYDAEQWLHEELRERGFWYHPGGFWTIEAFTPDCLPLTLRLIEETVLKEIPLE